MVIKTISKPKRPLTSNTYDSKQFFEKCLNIIEAFHTMPGEPSNFTMDYLTNDEEPDIIVTEYVIERTMAVIRQ